jgi:hypothetical protein
MRSGRAQPENNIASNSRTESERETASDVDASLGKLKSGLGFVDGPIIYACGCSCF